MEKWKTPKAAFSTFPQGLLREKEKQTKQSGGGLTTALLMGPDGPGRRAHARHGRTTEGGFLSDQPGGNLGDR